MTKKIVAPPEGAAAALGKKTHWRVFKKPPTVEGLAGEPVTSILTALTSPAVSSGARVLVIKVGDGQWLTTYGESYEDCVDKWRTAAAAAKPKITDDAALAAVLRDVVWEWCINRMYTAAGTLPPAKPKPKKPAAKKSKPRSR